MAFRLIGIGVCLILMGCNLQPDTPVVKPTEFDKITYHKQIKQERDSVRKLRKVPQKKGKTAVNPQINPTPIKVRTDTIPVTIRNGKARVDTLGQRLIFVFDSDTANKFSVKISTTDTISRLRINQIIDPKNYSEGPFGSETEYLIREKGLHKIIISEEIKNTNPRNASFIFEVKLGW